MKKIIILGFSLTLLICNCNSKKSNYEKPVELRGVYLNAFESNIFNSQRSIAEAMHFLGEHHFNAIFPEIRLDANMIYQCEIMDGLFGNTIDSLNSDRDPLAELIYEAHRQGLKVIPRIEYGPISNSQKNEMLASDTLLY
ncbi:MAG: family 10 glycosylhydrolase, partial [Candidatus Marinimicrobia bacterium]|nr:family 10 glycosylhydrolase [Candidatus Neomarinimicrobiota bacterium]